MILTQAPLRLSFVGGGTDLPAFYHHHVGRVISSSINKYVYVLVNPTPLIDRFTVKYSKTELVNHPEELQHTRVRAALLDLGLTKAGLEIGSFADLPSKTGLGSSSSFSLALLRALYEHQGRYAYPAELAEAAARLEIELLQEPIGKQDQYAAAFGGMNIITFHTNDQVTVEPVPLESWVKNMLEAHSLMFYTGITRDAGSVLQEQKENTAAKLETLKAMADLVPEFAGRMQAAEFSRLGGMLHEGWLKKKSLASGIANGVLDSLYTAALEAGAWGGKVLGAGGGGCLYFLLPIERRTAVRDALINLAAQHQLSDAREIPFAFTSHGCTTVWTAPN